MSYVNAFALDIEEPGHADADDLMSLLRNMGEPT